VRVLGSESGTTVTCAHSRACWLHAHGSIIAAELIIIAAIELEASNLLVADEDQIRTVW
jgi:hypothetical protein